MSQNRRSIKEEKSCNVSIVVKRKNSFSGVSILELSLVGRENEGVAGCVWGVNGEREEEEEGDAGEGTEKGDWSIEFPPLFTRFCLPYPIIESESWIWQNRESSENWLKTDSVLQKGDVVWRAKSNHFW